MKLKSLLLLLLVVTFNHVFSQNGTVSCDKFNINKISNDFNFPDEMLKVNVTNSDTTFWVYGRLDLISLTGDTIAFATSCGCSLLAPGATDSLNVFITKPFPIPANFSCYVVVGNTYPTCRKLYSSAQASVVDLNKNTRISIYPNPAKNNITVDLSGAAINSTNTLTIVNLQGQRVYTQPVTASKTKLDVSLLNSGIYFVQLYTNSVLTTTKKLVVE